MVHQASTKLVLVLRNPETTPEGAASMCAEFGHGIEVLAVNLAILEGRGCGQPLWVECTTAAHALAVAAWELVTACARGRDGASSEAAVQATGVVWNLAETKFKQLPKTNRVAYRRAIMGQSGTLKDTSEEFAAMVAKGPTADESSGGSNGAGACSGGGNDDDDDDDFFGDDGDDDDEQYGAEDLHVASACLEVMALARPTLKTALDAVDAAAAFTATQRAALGPPASGAGDEAATAVAALSIEPRSKPAAQEGGAVATAAAPPSPSSQQALQLGRVAALWRLCRRLTKAVVELGAALYPPLGREEVKRAAAALGAIAAEFGAELVAVADEAAGAEGAQGGALRRTGAIWIEALAKLNIAIESSLIAE